MTGTPALLVFAKRPEPGRVKTRLHARLTPEQASALYEAMLRDALDAYGALGVAVRLYHTPEGGPLPEDWLPERASQHAQRGDRLGERLLNAFVESFAAGHEAAVVIGTDHPTLPPAFVSHAFELLAEPLSVVLGPTADGGYYLLGINDLFPSLFRMDYSHDGVFADTLDRAGTVARHVSVLPEWFDVDDPEDLDRLAAELAAVPDEVAPRTRLVLSRLTQS